LDFTGYLLEVKRLSGMHLNFIGTYVSQFNINFLMACLSHFCKLNMFLYDLLCRLCIVFLAFDVFFVVFCVALACIIGIAVCCCLPCIIAILYAVSDQVWLFKCHEILDITCES